MNHFHSIRELLNTLSRGQKLLAEMFEKRRSLSYKYDYALDVMEGKEDEIKLLLSKNIIRQSGNGLELDDRFLLFFEEILEVNEEINTSYINENIRQVKDEYMLYFLQAASDSERFKYMKAVKSALRKIGRITGRNIIDLNRNIENAFKTEPNYKIKLSKLENYKAKLEAIQQMIVQTERLLNEDELTFFRTAADEELTYIKTELLIELTEARQNLIETRKQIIEYINQVKYQSRFIEKLKQLKYLRDQFEIRHKTNIVAVLSNTHSLAFEAKPSYPLKLSLENLQQDEVYQLIKKVNSKYRSGINPKKRIAEHLSAEDITAETEKEMHINLLDVKKNFAASGRHLFDYISEYTFPKEVSFGERVTIYCQMISVFENEFEVSENFERQGRIEYALVYPKFTISMNVPKQTAEIFELLSKGQFICSNSSDIRMSKLCEILDDADNFDNLHDYFSTISFILEKGDEFYYFSRKQEAKADLERKLEAACKWIDIVDFFKTFDASFASGYSFSPAKIVVDISVQAVLKNKADGLKSIFKMDEKTPYPDVVSKVVESLCRDGFAEMENEILRSYKVLSSFKYLEELINSIHIPEPVQHEIPE